MVKHFARLPFVSLKLHAKVGTLGHRDDNNGNTDFETKKTFNEPKEQNYRNECRRLGAILSSQLRQKICRSDELKN